MKEYRMVKDQKEQIEVIETVEVKRVINAEQLEREIEMIDTQIASLEAKKQEIQEDINEIGKLK
jgi:prefoldin subunit 5